MESNYLIIIDMQNDFLEGGALPVVGDTNKLVRDINRLQEEFDENYIYYTLDTHDNQYLESREGRYLPIPHCIDGTNGVELHPNLKVYNIDNMIVKGHFGSEKLCKRLRESVVFDFGGQTIYNPPKINFYFCGVATDICVLCNVIMAYNMIGSANIHIFEDLCLGTTLENHNKAIDIMKNLGVKIISYNKED